ncbi:hypothetical protein BT93_F1129 [Corymbia citriodora subsp. variegata]|nr:hypothetical protein BT93_F1129 [Corymbia citriodora subsp. variegata]
MAVTSMSAAIGKTNDPQLIICGFISLFRAIIKVMRTGPNNWYKVQGKKEEILHTVRNQSLDGEDKRNVKPVGNSPGSNLMKGSSEIRARGWSHSSTCHVC